MAAIADEDDFVFAKLMEMSCEGRVVNRREFSDVGTQEVFDWGKHFGGFDQGPFLEVIATYFLWEKFAITRNIKPNC